MKRILSLLAGLFLTSAAFAGGYVGDYTLGDTVYCKFGTVRPSTGASFTLGGTPALSAYPDNSTTQLTAGITLSADFDSVTGMNHVTVAATGANGYVANTFYSLQITTGTVDSVSVTGQEVCSFTLRKTNLSQDARGTLSGTHSATTADLGTNAPGATSQLAGMTLSIPAKFFSAVITSYNTGTGVATFSPSTALTLADGDYWELLPTPSSVFAADSITSTVIADNAITANKIAADAITSSEIATDAIGSAELAADAIGASEVAADAIGSSEVATDAIGAAEIAAAAIAASEIASDAIGAAELASDAATEVSTTMLTSQRILTGTCSSGSATTCVDAALTQADTTQLDDRLICFDDSWCALITDFTPGSDTVTTTKSAPSTRASKAYTIFPSTAQ